MTLLPRHVITGVLAGLFSMLAASAPMAHTVAQDMPVERPRGKPEAAPPEAAPPAAAAARDARREALLRSDARGTRVRVGGNVVVGEHERLGQVVAIFGRADVRGIITGDLVTVGGDIRLGPNAMVRGDIVAVGGTVRAENGAYIGGKVSEISFSTSDIRLWVPDDGEVTIAFQPDWPRIARITFISGIMRNVFWFVICAVLLAIAPGAVTRARAQAASSPIAAFAVGFAAEILFLPAMLVIAVLLSITIVGVPLLALLPVLGLVFLFAMAIGFTAVASGLGAQLVGRATPFAALVLGLTLIWGTGMAGHYIWTASNGAFGWGIALIAIGFAIEFLICTLGLGSALLAWSANRRPRAAAPAPAAPPLPDTNPVPQSL